METCHFFLRGLLPRGTRGESQQGNGSFNVRKIFQPSSPKRRKSMLRRRCTSAWKPPKSVTALQFDTMTARSPLQSTDSVRNVHVGRGLLRATSYLYQLVSDSKVCSGSHGAM